MLQINGQRIILQFIDRESIVYDNVHGELGLSVAINKLNCNRNGIKNYPWCMNANLFHIQYGQLFAMKYMLRPVDS